MKMWTETGRTLIEVLVALVLLDLGVVALAGTTAALTRLVTDADLAQRAAVAAASRRDRVVRAGCDGAASGAAREDPIEITWSVTDGGVVVTAAREAAPGRRVDTIAAECVP